MCNSCGGLSIQPYFPYAVFKLFRGTDCVMAHTVTIGIGGPNRYIQCLCCLFAVSDPHTDYGKNPQLCVERTILPK